jgi:hypothetical protein
MRTFIRNYCIFMMGSGILALHSALAFQGGEGTITSLRQELRSSDMTIEGSLACIERDKNTTDSCSLRINDKRTGKAFNLTNTQEAMKLLHAGQRDVVIQGNLADANTIKIGSINPR